MRTLLIIILLLVVICLGAPYVDGLMFKKVFMDQVAMHQERLRQQNLNLELVNYSQGWFTSTAKLKLTYMTQGTRYPLPPQSAYIDSVIHHGPIIVDPQTNTYTIAYGLINTNFHLPDAIKVFIPDNGTGYIHVTSVVSFDTKTWNNHFVFDPIQVLGKVKWDGVTGDNVVYYDQKRPMTIDSNTTIGALTVTPDPASPRMPQVNVQPMTFNLNAKEKEQYLWDGAAKLNAPGFTIKWQDGRNIELNHFGMNYKFGLNGDNSYSYKLDTNIDNLKLPQALPINDISGYKHSIDVINLNAKGLQTMVSDMRNSTAPSQEQVKQELPKVLNPNSELQSSLNANTNLGTVSGSMTVTLESVPATIDDLQKVTDANLTGRAAINLVETLITFTLQEKEATSAQQGTTPTTTTNVPTPQAKMRALVDSWLQQGYITKQNNDYVINFVKKGNTYTVNGKDVSAQFNLPQQPTTPTQTPTPTPSVTPSTPGATI